VAHRSTTYNDVRLVLIYDDGLLANQLNQLTNTAVLEGLRNARVPARVTRVT
jgi:hypothetical protein